MNIITIKEVSEKYGVTQDTLRYYERAGMLPAVSRTAGGNRDYQENDLNWIELVLCMRNAGLSVDAIVKYVQLAQQGDSTIQDRLVLLQEQRETLLKQQRQIAETIHRLDGKIDWYQNALRTGTLTCPKKKAENRQYKTRLKKEDKP